MIYPNQKAEKGEFGAMFFHDLLEIFVKPYFHVFGELFMVETTKYWFEPIEIECIHALGDPDLLNRIRCPER